MKTLLLAISLLIPSLSFAGGWVYQTYTDEMTDATLKFAGIAANGAELIVRCTDDHKNVTHYSNFEVYITTQGVTDTTNTKVVFRIDKNEPITVATHSAVDRRGEFLNRYTTIDAFKMDKIVSQLKTGSTVKVKVGMFVGNPKIYRFSLAGSTKTINKVLHACKGLY